MRVVAFNGSPRTDGNTAVLIRKVFEELESAGIETEFVQLGGRALHGCVACYQCFANKDGRCAVDKDELNDHVTKMVAADGIVLGSPTYFADITPETKALIDRAGLVSKANGDLLRRKVGAAVVAVRRAGSIHAFDSINHFFLIGQMIVPGSIYWNMSLAREKGEALNDEEGMETMKVLGQNMAWLLERIRGRGPK